MSGLHPQDREELLEALRPPEGFVLDEAIGTTYSLDLLALLVLPVGFTQMDLRGAGNGAIDAEPLKVLEAVRSMADKITLFCQAGQIKAPRRHHKLFALLERTIVQAKAAHPEGSLHAKTWALRFSGPDGEVRYRFICLSRNLTFDQSWDTIVAVEGECRLERKVGYKQSGPLRDFYRGLAALAVNVMDDRHRERLERFSQELALVEFTPFEPFTDLAFHPMGLGAKPWAPLNRRIDSLLVVSPFLDAEFLKRFSEPDHGDTVIERVISRPASLDEVGVKALEHIPAYALSLVPTPIETILEAPEAAESPAPTEEATDPDLAAPAHDLHAKIYVIDAGWDATILTGSANATARAFERNVEFLIGLTGKKSKVGIAATLDEAGNGLGRLAVSYQPQEVAPEVEAERSADRALDRWCQQVAAWPWQIEVIPTDGASSWTLRVTLTESRLGTPPDGCTTMVRPSGLPSHMGVNSVQAAQGVSFAIPGESSVTAFLTFEATLQTPHGPVHRRFTVPAPLVGASADRLQRVVSSMISDHGGLVEWLFLLLGDDPLPTQGDTTMGPTVAMGGRPRSRVPSAGLFEELVRAAVDAPERLLIAQAAISGLTDRGSDQPDLPAIKALLEQLTGGPRAST